MIGMTRYALALLSLLLCVQLPAQGVNELVSMRARWVQWELAGEDATTVFAQARRLAATQKDDGCWSEIDYGDQQRAQWKTARHLDHLVLLATAAYLQREDRVPDAGIDAASLRALRCWLTRDPRNPNWWWNEIGAPQLLARAALRMDALLSAEDRRGIDAILRRARWENWTGENLASGVKIEIARGLFDLDASAVREGFARLYQEIRVVPLRDAVGKPGEGIESDASFHQHGAQLYSGGYGFGFAEDAGRMIALGWGTSFAIPAEKMAVFSAFLLDGEQWMIHAGIFDYAARGREITRAEHVGKARMPAEFVRVVEALAALATPRQAELRRFAEALREQSGAGEITGNRYFWNSDFMEHKRAGYALSIRMLSTRTRNEETVNGEGLRSAHLADGATLLYKNGDEYRFVFPAWNWNLIPGTTALQWRSAAGDPVTGEAQPIGAYGSNSFAGGVSDGRVGAAAMELQRGLLTAKKAWFVFDHLFVALGAEISLGKMVTMPEVPVATSIEQCNRQGAVEEKTLADGRRVVAHHGVGYLLEADAQRGLTTGMQAGLWSEIGSGPAERVERPVFNLWLDHGTHPAGAHYQYEVFPEGGIEAAQEEAARPSVRVLANRGDLQAVEARDAQLVMAAFYRAGTLATAWGQLAVDAPCLILLREEQGRTEVTAANPRGTALALTVRLHGRAARFQLPGGALGGKSLTQTMPR